MYEKEKQGEHCAYPDRKICGNYDNLGRCKYLQYTGFRWYCSYKKPCS